MDGVLSSLIISLSSPSIIFVVPFCTFSHLSFFFFKWTTELYTRIQCPVHNTVQRMQSVTLSLPLLLFSTPLLTCMWIFQHPFCHSITTGAHTELFVLCFWAASLQFLGPKAFLTITCLMSIAHWTYLNKADTTISLPISIIAFRLLWSPAPERMWFFKNFPFVLIKWSSYTFLL